MPLSVVGLFGCWQGRFGRHRNGDIWKVVPLCLMWCIWKERNCRCFEDNERSMPDLKLLFLRTLFDWFSVWRNQPFSILDLLDFCNFRSWFVYPYILPVYLGASLFWYQWILFTYQKKNDYRWLLPVIWVALGVAPIFLGVTLIVNAWEFTYDFHMHIVSMIWRCISPYSFYRAS